MQPGEQAPASQWPPDAAQSASVLHAVVAAVQEPSTQVLGDVQSALVVHVAARPLLAITATITTAMTTPIATTTPAADGI